MGVVDTTRPREHIAIVTMNRPESRNAMNAELIAGLWSAFDDKVLDAAMAEADVILSNSPFGVQMTKEVMWSQLEIGSLQAGIDLENRTQLLASQTHDLAEAMRAFAEKRPPNFQNK